MFDKKSEYALNKHDKDSIIYISVVNVYTQRSEDSVKGRIEGNDSHGFTDRTRNEILEIENGEVKTIDCELTYTLGDDKEPYSLSVRTVINNEEIESLNYPLEASLWTRSINCWMVLCINRIFNKIGKSWIVLHECWKKHRLLVQIN